MFRIDYDRAANILHISVKGFLKPEDVLALSTLIDLKVEEARSASDAFDVIVESFEFPVQANDIADLLAEIMKRGIALTSGRAAVVVGSLLNKLQAERTLIHPRLKVVMTMEEADAWLAGDSLRARA